ncbi:MAG: hypothetical protein JO086_02320 [Acidimicrobiia bacterium]|nr:hypothetical protein [Acidimicrobiia bacterium]
MSFARRRSALLALLVAAIVLVSAGAAAAVSGGGYSQDQQDCPNNGSAWNTPPENQWGCHDVGVNLETGGTHNGDPNSANTRFGEFGIDESPNVSNNPSFGAVFNIGDPGTPASPHSGCLAANTDGTGGGKAVPGCGNNPNGLGFSSVWDYYDVYCPATAAIPLDSIPVPDGVPALKNCDGTPPARSSFTPDTGSQQKLDQIATQGLLLYLGANDGLDNGEHDGFSGLNNTDEAINGPSDGGAVILALTPQNAGNTPTAANPEGLANFSFGACADGICFGAATQRTTVYQGCGADSLKGKEAKEDKCSKGEAQNDDVFHNDAPASTKESPNCNGGGPASSETACYTNADGSSNAPSSKSEGGADAYRQETPHNMNMEPGVQTFQDPDPNRSPAAPIGTPGIYVGTCGVYVNDSNHTVGNGITGQDPGYIVPNQCAS